MATLLQMADVAKLIGNTISTTYVYVLRPDFPTPVMKVGRSSLWSLQDVKRWDAKRRKLPQLRKNAK